ncbi:hypothetical protein HHI36_010106 [Cryptolaemus montrouzieri]|uniref:Uncharacterized protein n=1 Tax=Cryptolaemus montrouzieri TaxID=559131 RepID=A0ABD2MI69_9CUCU
MNSMIIVGLLVAFTASASAGLLSAGYSGSSGGYNGGLLATGPAYSPGPLATSSITQQRIVNSIPIPTRIIASPAIASTSYYSGGQGGYGGSVGGSLGGGYSSGGSINGYGNLGGNYGRNGY